MPFFVPEMTRIRFFPKLVAFKFGQSAPYSFGSRNCIYLSSLVVDYPMKLAEFFRTHFLEHRTVRLDALCAQINIIRS